MSAPALLSFLTTYVRPVLDIGILAFLIYKTYQLLVMTEAVYLVRGLLILVAIYGAAFFLKLSTVTWIMNILAPGLVVSLAIIPQPELRRIFIQLGRQSIIRQKTAARTGWIDAAVSAAVYLSEKRRGALIVIARKVGLSSYIEKGIPLDAIISSSLLISVFEHDNPLHDGAAIITQGRLAAAGCFLPLSDQQDIRKTFGSRHRAALGISEESDAVVLIASEETGALSLAYDSKLFYDLSAEEILERLRILFSDHAGTGQSSEADNEV